MGIEYNIAQMVVHEHIRRPINGSVLLLGRQTMSFTPADAIDMIRSSGLSIPERTIEIDHQTLRSVEGEFIRDDEFFRLLGVSDFRALDHSDFEGADLIHDLNEPVPEELCGIADFILDGSTLDNVWDPATAVRNVARMLKPHGRFISINMGSNHFTPYIVITPQWLLDYFVVNDFNDCKAYMFIYGDAGELTVVTPDAARLTVSGSNTLNNFVSSATMGVVVVAEKGPASTWNRNPSQQHYRSEAEMASFRQTLDRMIALGRTHPARSRRSTHNAYQRDGWVYVDEAGFEQTVEGEQAAVPEQTVEGEQAGVPEQTVEGEQIALPEQNVQTKRTLGDCRTSIADYKRANWSGSLVTAFCSGLGQSGADQGFHQDPAMRAEAAAT